MSDKTKKSRARHVASDEAHAWARSLPLNNPNAKTVLRALALYVNGEGCCFVGLDQLSEDTDLSADTVRRRLVWLEQVGAIVRLPQWLDGNGVRNGEGRGKRTSDEIRMLLQADVDEIERRARGQDAGDNSGISSTETTEISPSSLRGLNEAEESVSPRLAPRQPLQSCEGLISEPEPEDSPQPPFGGSAAIEGWKEFQEDWQEPILRQSIAQQVWAALTPTERNLARQAARGYVAHRKAQKKPPNVLGAHLFLKERDAWDGFAKLAPHATSAASGTYAPDSPESKALAVLYDIAGATEAYRKILCGRDGLVRYRLPMTARLFALAQAPPKDDWPILTRQQAGAWESLLRDTVTVQVRQHLHEGSHAPWAFPPSVEGKLYDTTGPPDTLMTEQDMADFKS